MIKKLAKKEEETKRQTEESIKKLAKEEEAKRQAEWVQKLAKEETKRQAISERKRAIRMARREAQKPRREAERARREAVEKARQSGRQAMQADLEAGEKRNADEKKQEALEQRRKAHRARIEAAPFETCLTCMENGLKCPRGLPCRPCINMGGTKWCRHKHDDAYKTSFYTGRDERLRGRILTFSPGGDLFDVSFITDKDAANREQSQVNEA